MYIFQNLINYEELLLTIHHKAGNDVPLGCISEDYLYQYLSDHIETLFDKGIDKDNEITDILFGWIDCSNIKNVIVLKSFFKKIIVDDMEFSFPIILMEKNV